MSVLFALKSCQNPVPAIYFLCNFSRTSGCVAHYVGFDLMTNEADHLLRYLLAMSNHLCRVIWSVLPLFMLRQLPLPYKFVEILEVFWEFGNKKL